MHLRENLVEALIGALVLGVGGLFVSYAYTHTEIGRASSGYELKATFPNAVGVNVGTDVRISGIKVGAVSSQALDPKTFQAKLTFSVKNDIKLPTDTSARIASEGLLGGTYIDLTPGGDEETLQPGEEITQTQGSVDLMSLVGRAVFSAGSTPKKGDSAPPSNSTAEVGSPPAEAKP